MNKLLAKIVVGTLLVGLILISGCGTQTSTNTQSPTDSQPKQEVQPKVLTLGTHGVGSILNTMGTGIATVLSKTMSIEVKAVAMTGPMEWMPMLQSNEMDMGVLNSWDAEMGWKGKSTYGPISKDKGFPISLITSGHKGMVTLITSKDSGITKGSDLKGKRVVVGVTGSPGITAQGDAQLANFGLQQSDVKSQTVPSIDAGIRAVIEGRADACISGQIGMGVISELDSSKGARFLSCDNSLEAVKRLQEKFPAKLVKVSPSKDKVGILEDTWFMSYDFYLVGRNNLSETTVYNVVKSLWEKNQDLAAINVNLQDWTPENFVVDNFTVPYHPGAIKFYKEKGVWTPAMEKLQQSLLAK